MAGWTLLTCISSASLWAVVAATMTQLQKVLHQTKTVTVEQLKKAGKN